MRSLEQRGAGQVAFLQSHVGVVEKEERFDLSKESEGPTLEPADPGRLRKAFCLPDLSLNDEIMERGEFDLDLLEFLVAPISLQMIDPENGRKLGRSRAANNHGDCTCARVSEAVNGPTAGSARLGQSHPSRILRLSPEGHGVFC